LDPADKENLLNNTLQFLNQQVRTIQDHLETLEKGEKDLQLCRLLRNFQVMRTLTIQRIPQAKTSSSWKKEDCAISLPPHLMSRSEFNRQIKIEENLPLNTTTTFEEIAASIAEVGSEFISEEDFFHEFVCENTPFRHQPRRISSNLTNDPRIDSTPFETLEDCLDLPPAQFLQGLILTDEYLPLSKRRRLTQ